MLLLFFSTAIKSSNRLYQKIKVKVNNGKKGIFPVFTNGITHRAPQSIKILLLTAAAVYMQHIFPLRVIY